MSEKKDTSRGDAGKKKSKKEEIDYKELAENNLNGWQKALADYQNLEKEMDKKLSDMNEFVAAGFILELLPIFDNYRVAISHIPDEEKDSSWAVGLEHILKLWQGFLEGHGVEQIKTIDQKFDTNLHESVGQIEDSNIDDQTIVEEKLAGYKKGDKVIRPAKVVINNKS